ncbi:porin [Roseicitreum antarcticum]|nr:porin [Roseicitreum antarcticum]
MPIPKPYRNHTVSILLFLAFLPGPALAQITMTGEARMGVVAADSGPDKGVKFDSRIRVRLQMQGQTDNGLTFGVEVDHDVNRPDARPRGSVFIGQ